MSGFSFSFELIDIHSSWHSANQIPISTFAYLRSSRLATSTFSAAFRRTRRGHGKISSSTTPAPSARSPEIRRPRELANTGNGFSLVSLNSASTSSCRDEVVSDLDLFLKLVPLRMRNELFKHDEIGQLIEVVMDLGRKPLARFPSGDWVISEQTVKLEDLRHAISKVVPVNFVDHLSFKLTYSREMFKYLITLNQIIVNSS